MGDSEPGYLSDDNDGSVTMTPFKNVHTSTYIPVSAGDVFTIQLWATSDVAYHMISYMWFKDKDANSHIGSRYRTAKEVLGYIYLTAVTAPAPANAKYIRVDARFYDDGRIKVERGSTATDWTPAPEDVVTKVPPDIFEALDGIPEMHRNIFRGKNLGSVYTDEQKAAVADGSFHDIWLGDYWAINNYTWRIVDINYWYNKSNLNQLVNHVVIMPDDGLYKYKMNPTNTTDGAYKNSDMYINGLTEAKNVINTAFGTDFIYKHNIVLNNKVTNGIHTGNEWLISTVELPNEIMMYGCYIFTLPGNGSIFPAQYTVDFTQLALFKVCPLFIFAKGKFTWLRDVGSPSNFTIVGPSGEASCVSANDERGYVRPIFGITGGATASDEADDDVDVIE